MSISTHILNFGSLNIDYVYTLDSFVQPGETKACLKYKQYLGGKGLNQSVALKRAGLDKVQHVAALGTNATQFTELMEQEGIDYSFTEESTLPSGHAMIQVNNSGENQIVIYHGANHALTLPLIHSALDRAPADAWVLLQNEINLGDKIIEHAAQKGLKIVFNPAPMTQDTFNYPLELVAMLVLNHAEALMLCNGRDVHTLADKYPHCEIIITRGEQGVLYLAGQQRLQIPAFKVAAKDTTAAGDTFVGYFVAMRMQNKSLQDSLTIATAAAALAVTKLGAISSIPDYQQVEQFLKEHV